MNENCSGIRKVGTHTKAGPPLGEEVVDKATSSVARVIVDSSTTVVVDNSTTADRGNTTNLIDIVEYRVSKFRANSIGPRVTNL
jgi:hypothetical protein